MCFLHKYNVIILFSKQKTHYSVYGRHAMYIATTFFRTKKSISYFGASEKDSENQGLRIECLHFKEIKLKDIIQDFLLRQNKNIEIYEKNTNRSNIYNTERSNPWTLIKKASRSNLTAVDSLIGNSIIDSSFNLLSVVFNLSSKTVCISIIFPTNFRVSVL